MWIRTQTGFDCQEKPDPDPNYLSLPLYFSLSIFDFLKMFQKSKNTLTKKKYFFGLDIHTENERYWRNFGGPWTIFGEKDTNNT